MLGNYNEPKKQNKTFQVTGGEPLVSLGCLTSGKTGTTSQRESENHLFLSDFAVNSLNNTHKHIDYSGAFKPEGVLHMFLRPVPL